MQIASPDCLMNRKTLIPCEMVYANEIILSIWIGVAMEIGQKVRVSRLRDRAPEEVIQHLGQVGVVQGYKMVDGSGVGRVVKFEDNFSTWFFEDELDPES